MEETPLISIIFPVYNAEKYLKYSLNSIFCQTIQDWELIIIDDGSIDNSINIINKINDKRIKKIKNDRNYGHAFSCNRGIKMASGRYIARMDADDISFPNRFEIQLDYMNSHPDVDVIGCGSIKMDSELKKIYNVDYPPSNHNLIIKLYWFNKQLLFGTNIWMTDGALFARLDWFKKWNYNPSIPFAQDFDLMFRSHNKSQFGNVSELLYIYRKSGETSSYISQLKAIYYKNWTILKYGFNKNSWKRSFIGLMVNTIRIFTSLCIIVAQKFGYGTFYKKDLKLTSKVNKLIQYLNNMN